MSLSPAERMMAARCRLMTREPWYGHMAMSMHWIESEMSWLPEEARTMGIKITGNNEIQCHYYPAWAENTPLERMYGAIEHVINHLVRLHTLRASGKNPMAWAIATDMAVNGRKNNARIGYRGDDGVLILPFKDMIFIPDDWPENETAEYYYDRMVKESPDNGTPGGGEGEDSEGEGSGGGGDGDDGNGQEAGAGQGQAKSGNGANQYKYGKFGGAAVDDHEIWSQSDISEDEARQLINERAKDASQKAQGHTPGHLKEVLEKLNKPIVKWRDILRQFLGIHVGSRRKTYSRADRRNGDFGTKGISHHANCSVTVIVDSSGSISTKELEQFFTEIEAIAYRAKLSLIIWDAALQGIIAKYRKGDWKKIQIRGGGGTDMAAPVTWAEENGLITDVGIMLTDGVCNWPGPRPYPMIFCITTPAGSTAAPEWGTTIRMKLE